MEFIMKDLREGYVQLVDTVRRMGTEVIVRGMTTYELTNVTLSFPDVYNDMLPVGVGRKINQRLAAVEALELISGESRPELIKIAAPQYIEVLAGKDNDEMTQNAYGPRTKSQLNSVVDVLLADPSSRQAVVSIWQPHDLTHEGDKPCTIFLQFLIRSDKLELHAHMRSNDVWLGTAYDIFNFTQLQHTVARHLGVEAGEFILHATSLHIYDRDVEASRELSDVVRSTELPVGVLCDEDEDFQEVARNLLDNTGGVFGNAWYFEQMSKVHGA